MPINRFPDSIEKRELRRLDRRALERFCANQHHSTGLQYCGMPSVQFLDVREWKSILRSVDAIEYDPEVLKDMRLTWPTFEMGIPVEFHELNVTEYLGITSKVFDLYNLDFYGGFLHETKSGASKTANAIRSLIHRQAENQRSFVLIATFNIRENAAAEYEKFLTAIPKTLHGWKGVKANCDFHNSKPYLKTKFGFCYFCSDTGRTNKFDTSFNRIYMYNSGSTTLLHFWCEFSFKEQAIPTIADPANLAELANMPLYVMKGQVAERKFVPPEIHSLGHS